jgi:uncharacterized protein (TIGR02466 family)
MITLHSLFPTPVTFFNIERDLTEIERSFLLNQDTRKSMGNAMTTDVEILNNKELSSIRHFIQTSLNTHLEHIYDPKTECRLEITQSWVNYTQPGEYHHRHDHPNSALSGVFYIDVEDDVDSIFFFNREYRQLQISPKAHNVFNSDSWSFPVKTGELVIFPSSLPHMVTVTKSSRSRISLAFNTFFKGDIGDINGLTNLQI